jgi:hypothetical protein
VILPTIQTRKKFMLIFYGIRFNKQGVPERFSLSFALRESLNAALYIFDHCEGDLDRTLRAIEEEINRIFLGVNQQNPLQGKFRLTVAKWFRTRDIIRFIAGETVGLTGCGPAIGRILNTPESMAAKWQAIEAILLERLVDLAGSEREKQLTEPESDLNLILQMVGLFFLEQDDEIPPVNLEMQFIRQRFPRVIWKKKDGFSAGTGPFWLPANPYCRPTFLLTRLVAGLAARIGGAAVVPGLPAVAGSVIPTAVLPPDRETQALCDTLLPDEPPSELRIEAAQDGDDDLQLTYLPESVAETLLSLQKMVQSHYRHEGVRHLLAIFRQLGAAEGETCAFDPDGHLALVTCRRKSGGFSEKQRAIFEDIMTILLKLRVKRFWKTEWGVKCIDRPLLLELGRESSGVDGASPIRRLWLDPIFRPDRRNPFRLGQHLAIMPEGLFRENIHQHILLPALGSFFCGCWVNEYPTQKGVTLKTTREIIEGTACRITPATRFRLLNKVKSELAYMAKKCYIQDYSLEADDHGNPWDDRHRITAGETIIAAIEAEYQRIDSNRCPERLIA